MEKMGDNFFEKALAASKKSVDSFNVLNHGDLWSNNMMYQYDKKGKLKDMRFVSNLFFNIVLSIFKIYIQCFYF